MHSISSTDFRKNLKDVLDRAESNREPILITRGGIGSAVLMSAGDFRSLEETVYLLRSPKNARRLLDSLAQTRDGMVRERGLIEED